MKGLRRISPPHVTLGRRKLNEYEVTQLCLDVLKGNVLYEPKKLKFRDIKGNWFKIDHNGQIVGLTDPESLPHGFNMLSELYSNLFVLQNAKFSEQTEAGVSGKSTQSLDKSR